MSKSIGVLGGGQLGRMLAEAASPLDLDIQFMDAALTCPVGQMWSKFTEGDINDYDDVVKFGKDLDVITIEIEGVNEKALEALQQQGKEVYPQPHILSLIKDKGFQKQFYKENRLATSNFKLYDGKEEILEAVASGQLKVPFVQKARTGGYDGKGVHVVRSEDDLNDLMDVSCLTEDLVDIEKEIGVVVCRSIDGDIKSFPIVEMEFHPEANLVEHLFSPSNLSNAQQMEAIALAELLVEKLGIVGLLAVELFEDTEGNIIINEVAPRPHNSGHHTIEACVTSQYQQHLRAISGLPLGNTALNQSAVMINILGEEGHTGPAHYEGLWEVLKMSGVYPHIYGKKITKPYRKMGHITIVDKNLKTALAKAEEIKSIFKVITL